MAAGVANNALMAHGQVGLCGLVGEHEGMGISSSMGMNNNSGMLQQQFQFQQSQEQYSGQQVPFNGQQNYGQVQTKEELNQFIDTAEIKAYEMRLRAKKMMLQQQMQMSENQWHEGAIQYSNEIIERNMSQWSGLSRADLMRELRLEQDRLLVAAAQKQMAMSTGMISMNDSNSFFEQGLSAENQFVDRPGFSPELKRPSLSQQTWYEQQQLEQRTRNSSAYLDEQFEHRNRNDSQRSYQDRQLERRYTNPTVYQNGHFDGGHTNQSAHQHGQLQRRHTNPPASTAYEQNTNYVDLTMSPQPRMQHMRNQMMSPTDLNQVQNQLGYYEGQNPPHSPSPHVEEMMNQYQVQQNPIHQGDLPQKNSVGQPYHHMQKLEESSSEATENAEPQSNLQPQVDDTTFKDSLGISDLQAWLAFKSSGGESIGFHSVGSMSASFGSVMTSSILNVDDDPVTHGHSGGGNGTPLRKITNDGSPEASDRSVGKSPYHDSPCSPSYHDIIQDLAPIAEDSLEEEDQKSNFGTSNARKNRAGDPLKISLTIGDLQQRRDLERSIQPGLSQNSGMSFTIGDSIGELGDLLNSNLSEGIGNSHLSPGLMTNSVGMTQSDLMMSIDSVTYSALMAANQSNSSMTMNRDLCELLEEENESRSSTASTVGDNASDKSAPLSLSGGSKTSGSTKRSVTSLGGRRRRSADSRPSIMSEISEWSSSNPYGDDSVQNAEEQDHSPNEADNKGHHKVEVDVTELDALSDSVDISLSMMSSMCLAEAEDTLMMSLQKSEGYVSSKGSKDEK
eukprot:CCRYP_012137-RA/>CCRYP_012137-RA protein AED:0.06 eAED:0.06 QI:369/1/1/1/1/1/2/159/787